jgi:hypothetical protein
MSLFSQLRHLYRPDRFQLEDFHTEIVAQVLRNSQALTMAWLSGIGITTLKNPDAIQIATQEEFAKLAGHSTDSRPDIAIRLVAGGNTELILIESKVPSKQGPDQLQRYADHLADSKNRRGLQKTSLVFITRDYESAAPSLLAGQTLTLARWFQFYRYLKAHVNGDGLAKELKLFMEENRMSLGNQFRSTDLVSLENFLSAKALMDETLQGEVSEAASKVLGGVSSLKKAPNQLRDHHRYVLYAGFGAFECLIGYWLPHENPDEPVWVGITLYSNPWAEARRDVIEAFRGWLKKRDGSWSADDLDDEKEWSCIYKGKAIQAVMGEIDHVRAIKDQFLSLLKEVAAFRKTYPKLPWGTTDAVDASDEEESG